MLRRLCLGMGTAVSAAAVAAPTAASTPEPLPPYVAAYEPRSVDERGMWMEADEIERQLRDSPIILRDEGLNAYVRRVLCETVGEERCRSVRIYVVEMPAFNATMMANGAMTVWSGLLLRVRSEAELAAVQGHEFAHFELRHSLNGFRQRRTASDVAAWAFALGGLANTYTGDIQIALLGSIFRFNRAQEEEADLLGLRYLHLSRYPASAASDLWRHVMAESDATTVGRGRRPRQRYSAGFFDSHPTELRRATVLAEAAAPLDDPGDPAAVGHRRALTGHLPRFLAAQIAINNFGGSEYLLHQLSRVEGWTGELLFARGELYRQRGNPRDLVSAADFYGQAIQAGYVVPEVHRNLGLALLRNGEGTRGREALAEYLRLLPQASDAATITALMGN